MILHAQILGNDIKQKVKEISKFYKNTVVIIRIANLSQI